MWQNFYSRCIPNRNVHTYVLKSVQNMFITVLFRVTPSCKQLRSPSTLEQVHKLWHIHSFSGILHRNKNELSTHSNVHKSHNVELKKPDPKEYFRCNSIYMKLNHKQTNVWGRSHDICCSWLERGISDWGSHEGGFCMLVMYFWIWVVNRWMYSFLMSLYKHNFEVL